MRIISKNTCSQCCYCIEDYDGFGLCCKDNIYKNISINQHACRCFCGDNDESDYYNNNINNNYNDVDDINDYD